MSQQPDLQPIDAPADPNAEPDRTAGPRTPHTAVFIREAIAEAMRQPSTPLISLFPQLTLLQDLPLLPRPWLPDGIEPFAARTITVLRRNDITRWHHLFLVTIDEFASWPRVGDVTVTDLLRVLSELNSHDLAGAITDTADRPAPAGDLPPAVRVARMLTSAQLDALATGCRWVSAAGPAESLGSLLLTEASSPAGVPPSGEVQVPDDVAAPFGSDITRSLVLDATGLSLDEPAFDVIRLINRTRLVDGWLRTGELDT